MTRETLDRKIHELMDEILVLGSMVEEAIAGSVESLKQRDIEASRLIYKNDALFSPLTRQVRQDRSRPSHALGSPHQRRQSEFVTPLDARTRFGYADSLRISRSHTVRPIAVANPASIQLAQ